MIIAKTPLRISFVGGGSDLPAFYRQYGGATISVAINKYIYVGVNKRFDDEIRASYSQTEIVDSPDKLDHTIIKNTLIKENILKGVEIVSVADIPGNGTGLGSSSTFTAGLLNAVGAYKGETRTKADLAQGACEMEIDICGYSIGKQDQYAAAYGGMNFIEYNPDDTVSVHPLDVCTDKLTALNNSLMVFYTGNGRSAANILEKQSNNLRNADDKIAAMHTMLKLIPDFKNALLQADIQNIGHILDAGWQMKKQQAEGISNPAIDDIYAAALQAGAYGGKVLGAGGGGFIAFIVPDSQKASVRKALSHLTELDVGFDMAGSVIKTI